MHQLIGLVAHDNSSLDDLETRIRHYTLFVQHKGLPRLLDSSNWDELVREGAHIKQFMFSPRSTYSPRSHGPWLPTCQGEIYTSGLDDTTLNCAQDIPLHHDNKCKWELALSESTLPEAARLDDLEYIPQSPAGPLHQAITWLLSNHPSEQIEVYDALYKHCIVYDVPLNKNTFLDLSIWDIPPILDSAMNLLPEEDLIWDEYTCVSHGGFFVGYDASFHLMIQYFCFYRVFIKETDISPAGWRRLAGDDGIHNTGWVVDQSSLNF